MTNKQAKLESFEIMGDGKDIFIILDGLKIAKRGRYGTPYAKQWISLEPGFVVRDVDGGETIQIERAGDVPVN